MPRIFTVEEANAFIPRLERILMRIRELRDTILMLSDKLQVLDALWGEKVTDPSNPDHAEFHAYRKQIADTAAAIEEVVKTEILAHGLRFPVGGIEHGLIDFPTVYEDRVVYLCWRSSETCILAWHEVDGGFAGRQDLTQEQALLMGRVAPPPPT